MSVVSVEREDDEIVVTMPYNEDAKDELKTQFGARWDPDDKVWRINGDDHDIEDVKREVKVHFPRAYL